MRQGVIHPALDSAIVHAASTPPANALHEPAQQCHDAIEARAIGRLQSTHGAEALLDEHWLFLAESQKAALAVIGTHAAFSDTAKGLGVLRELVQAVIDAHAA